MSHDKAPGAITEQEIPLETATVIIVDALNLACWDICLDVKACGPGEVKIRNAGKGIVRLYGFKPVITDKRELIEATKACAEHACRMSDLANKDEIRKRVVQDAAAEVERLLDVAPVMAP